MILKTTSAKDADRFVLFTLKFARRQLFPLKKINHFEIKSGEKQSFNKLKALIAYAFEPNVRLFSKDKKESILNPVIEKEVHT